MIFYYFANSAEIAFPFEIDFMHYDRHYLYRSSLIAVHIVKLFATSDN